MKEADEHRREMEALRERLTRLSEASLRVNENLDEKEPVGAGHWAA